MEGYKEMFAGVGGVNCKNVCGGGPSLGYKEHV